MDISSEVCGGCGNAYKWEISGTTVITKYVCLFVYSLSNMRIGLPHWPMGNISLAGHVISLSGLVNGAE
jgi:hypothetical protein